MNKKVLFRLLIAIVAASLLVRPPTPLGAVSAAAAPGTPAPALVLLLPGDGDTATTYTPTYTWEESAAATHYKLWLGKPDGTQTFAQWYTREQVACNGSTCQFKSSQVINAGQNRWCVKSYNSSGGAWSNPCHTFNSPGAAGQPVLQAPSAGTTTPSYYPIYTWSDVETATQYKLVVYNAGGTQVFGQWYTRDQLYCSDGNCHVSPDLGLGSGVYTWYVKSYNPAGGAWSTQGSFTTPAAAAVQPVLKTPSASIAPGARVFTWSGDASATYYKLYVATQGGALVFAQWVTPVEANCKAVTACALTPQLTLAAGNYTWLVKAYNPNGGAWSSAMPFSVEPAGFLDELAKDTWNYLHSDWATDNHLPWSWRSTTSSSGSYANPAEIGFYALSWVAAYDLQRSWSPSWAATEAEVAAVLDQLRAWQSGFQSQQPNGANAYNHSVFYQWYWVANTPPVVGAGAGDHLVPSIDNAWLAASLLTLRGYAGANNHPALAQKADAILKDMDFMLWYHADTHRFSWGAAEDPQGGGEADYYSNENRIINFVARALGQMSAEEFRLSLAALTQNPKSYAGTLVEKAAWDGSYFTYAGPALFMREMDTWYGLNTLLLATQAQMAYAEDQNYAAWGLSDAFNIGDGDYVQQGAPPAATTDPIEIKPGLVTPHASALALITSLAPDALTNLQNIASTFGCAYDPGYGFHDSVMTKLTDPDYGQCSNRFSALDQEWIFLAAANHETGFIWNYFYRNAGVGVAQRDMTGITPAPFRGGLDEPASDWGVYLEGAPLSDLKNVTTPSLDGKSLQCSITGGSPYSNVHCYRNLPSEPGADSFVLSLSFRYTPVSTCNNQGGSSIVQALEFTLNQWYRGYRYEIALQWQNVGDGAPQWRYWDPNQPSQPAKWVAISPQVSQCLEGDRWHTLLMKGKIINGQVEYQSFAIDDQVHALNITLAPIATPGEIDRLAVAVQLDGNSSETPYHLFIDRINFYPGVYP